MMTASNTSNTTPPFSEEPEYDQDFTPSTQPPRPELILKLHQLERERIRPLEHDGMRRERILDRATDKLLRRVSDGDPPSDPGAWYRRVVDNLLNSKEIPRSRERIVEDLEVAAAVTGLIHTPTDSENEAEDRREAKWRELFELRREWLLLHMPTLLPDVAQFTEPMLHYRTWRTSMRP